MGARSKAKTAHGTTNDNRPNRKAYKKGKSPEIRATEAKRKAFEKRERKRSADIQTQMHLYTSTHPAYKNL